MALRAGKFTGKSGCLYDLEHQVAESPNNYGPKEHDFSEGFVA
jgi:hypothetical protein